MSTNVKYLNCLKVEFIYFCIAALFLLFSTTAYTGEISGNVRNYQSYRPIADVEVCVQELSLCTETDSSGEFFFDSIPSGTYNLLFKQNRYEPVIRNDVYVAGDGKKHVDVDLIPQVQSLEKMVVKASSFHKAPEMISSTKIINNDELLRAPGALTDIQRIVQNLPSVCSGADNINEVIVRGGMQGENMFIMDNIEIPNPNHFAQQGAGGGVLSLLNPLLVKQVTFNAGPAPAYYGGKASSVLDVKLREGNNKIILGGIDFGVTGAGFHGEGPMWPKSTFLLSGTKSYLDFLAKFEPNIAIPRYWAVQSKVTQNFENSKIYLNGIGGGSGITIRDTGKTLPSEVIISGGKVYASGITWEHFWGEKLKSYITVASVGNGFERCGYDTSGVSNDTLFTNDSHEHEQTCRLKFDYNFENGARLVSGIYGRRCDFNIAVWDKPDTLKQYFPDTAGDTLSKVVFDSNQIPVCKPPQRLARDKSYKGGGFISAYFPFENGWTVVAGIRFDAFTYNNNFRASPRLSISYTLHNGLTLSSAFGIQNQFPVYSDLIIHSKNRTLPPKRATIGVCGMEYLVKPLKVKFTLEGFYKYYSNLTKDISFLSNDSNDVKYNFLRSYKLKPEGEGRSFGVEIFAQKKLTEMMFFTAAYSFSRSFWRFPNLAGGKWHPGDFDFRNILTLTGGLKHELINKKWYKRMRSHLWFKLLTPVMPIADRQEYSIRFRYRGGRPYTRHFYDTEFRRWKIDLTEPNSLRLNAYHRLDLRWERRYGFGPVHLIYYFEIQNVYSQRNIWTYLYNDDIAKPVRIEQLPVFPAGGIIVGF